MCVSECVSVSESQMAVPDGERAFPVASIVRRRNKKKRRRGSHQWLEKKQSVRYRGERTTIIIFSTLCLPNFRRPFFPLLFSSKDLSSVCIPLYIKFGWFLPNKRHVYFCFFFFGRFLLLYLLHTSNANSESEHVGPWSCHAYGACSSSSSISNKQKQLRFYIGNVIDIV